MTNEVKISAHYQLTVADHLEAIQLYNQKFKGFIRSFYLLPILLLYILIDVYRFKDPTFFVLIQSSYVYSNEELCLNIWMSLILFWLLILSQLFPKFDPLSWWLISKKCQKNFVRLESKQIAISTTGVNITSQNYREYRAWENIDRVLENKKLFLLCDFRGQERTIIPKRIFDSEVATKDFQDLLTKARSQKLEANNIINSPS